MFDAAPRTPHLLTGSASAHTHAYFLVRRSLLRKGEQIPGVQRGNWIKQRCLRYMMDSTKCMHLPPRTRKERNREKERKREKEYWNVYFSSVLFTMKHDLLFYIVYIKIYCYLLSSLLLLCCCFCCCYCCCCCCVNTCLKFYI